MRCGEIMSIWVRKLSKFALRFGMAQLHEMIIRLYIRRDSHVLLVILKLPNSIGKPLRKWRDDILLLRRGRRRFLRLSGSCFLVARERASNLPSQRVGLSEGRFELEVRRYQILGREVSLSHPHRVPAIGVGGRRWPECRGGRGASSGGCQCQA